MYSDRVPIGFEDESNDDEMNIHWMEEMTRSNEEEEQEIRFRPNEEMKKYFKKYMDVNASEIEKRLYISFYIVFRIETYNISRYLLT